MARIFLSYRREDTAGHAGRIFDHLSSRFGEGRVFLDVEGIEAGENFATAIERSIADCDTVVAVIGKAWAGDALSGRRIDNPRDYVRQEIETAMRLGVELVPVVVAGARMPTAAELPESLAELAVRNALPIDDKTFLEGLDRLIATLEKTSARAIERRRLQRPPKPQPLGEPVVHRRSGLWMLLRRLLLFYTPPQPAMLILHVFFYLLLLSGAASIPLALNDPATGRMLAISYGAMLVLLRVIVALVEPGSALGGEKWQPFRRALLLYAPTPAAMWIVHALFYFMLVGGVIGVAIGAREDFAATLPIAGSLAVILLILRAVAIVIEPDHTTNRMRRWWLLYKPPRTSTAALHVVFVIMLLLVVSMASALGSNMGEEPNDVSRVLVAEAVLWIAVLTFAVREIAALRDPLRPAGARQNWFGRLWFVNRPKRSAAWIPRVVFYVASVAFLISLPGGLADDSGNLTAPTLRGNTGPIVLLAIYFCLAVAARGAARSAEAFRLRRTTPRPPAQRIRGLLLLHRPSSTAGYAPQLLFWLAVAFAINVFITREAGMIRLGLPPTDWVLVGVFTGLVVASAYGWAQMFVPRGVRRSVVDEALV